jgi:aminopeptidase-like protein
MDKDIGNILHSWIEDLFPICRSITGPGVRETLLYFKEILPNLKIHSVPTGTKVFDWTVPKEWIIKDAYIEDEYGKKVVDFKNNNLHVVGYSEPVDRWLDLDSLDKYLHSLEDQPNAIPYITSYYKKNWGFCLTHKQRELLKNGLYHVVIDSELKQGVLNYGELIIKGESDEEVFLSTYICHPSMANNELSGPVVTAGIAQWLNTLTKRKYTYRIIFIPETIGSIVYLSRHIDYLKTHTVAGFVVNCIGDERAYSFMPSRSGDSLSDRAALYALNNYIESFDVYSFLDRGSDERQYCSPGVDLPVCSVMRSKYGTYPEYHTSLDNLEFVTPDGLKGGFFILKEIIKILEINDTYQTTCLCEPQLGKYNLYPSVSTKNSTNEVYNMLNIFTYSDGESDLIELSNTIGVDIITLYKMIIRYEKLGLMKKIIKG